MLVTLCTRAKPNKFSPLYGFVENRDLATTTETASRLEGLKWG